MSTEDKDRAEFESKFPIPTGIGRCADDGRCFPYAPTCYDDGPDAARTYSLMYKVWQAAKESSRKELERLEAALTISNHKSITLSSVAVKELEEEREIYDLTSKALNHVTNELEAAKQRIAEILPIAEAWARFVSLQSGNVKELCNVAVENESLKAQLAEQQAAMQLANMAFTRTADEYRNNYLRGGSVQASDLRVEAWRAIATCGTEELTKREAAARQQGFEEGKKAVVPEWNVSVPRDVVKRASQSLAAFCGDEGWSQTDMDNMDELDAWLAAPQPKG